MVKIKEAATEFLANRGRSDGSLERVWADCRTPSVV
jgi:hypothetical protein